MLEKLVTNLKGKNEEELLTKLLDDEYNDLELAILDEPKNYHAWQYRQWLLQISGAWERELECITSLIEQDPYNNSAWNQRYFLLMNKNLELKSEIEYVIHQLTRADNNASAQAYLGALEAL